MNSSAQSKSKVLSTLTQNDSLFYISFHLHMPLPRNLTPSLSSFTFLPSVHGYPISWVRIPFHIYNTLGFRNRKGNILTHIELKHNVISYTVLLNIYLAYFTSLQMAGNDLHLKTLYIRILNWVICVINLNSLIN